MKLQSSEGEKYELTRPLNSMFLCILDGLHLHDHIVFFSFR